MSLLKGPLRRRGRETYCKEHPFKVLNWRRLSLIPTARDTFQNGFIVDAERFREEAIQKPFKREMMQNQYAIIKGFLRQEHDCLSISSLG